MLDFPASPTNGQLFTGVNGVVYQWNSASGLWLVYGTGPNSAIVGDTPPSNPTGGQFWFNSALGQTFVWYTDPNSSQWVPANPSTAATAGTTPGDFCVSGTSATNGIPLSPVVWSAGTVVSGNAGGWYNSSNGRWTPPAGRYLVYATMTAVAGGGASGIQIALRKNGTVLSTGQDVTAQANYGAQSSVFLNVDANGTDYFDVTVASLSYTATASQMIFGAIPIGTVVYTTPGPAWRQLGRVIPTAGQATVDFQNVPADINDLELRYDVLNQTTDVTLWCQFYDGSGALVSANYNWSVGVQNGNATANTAVTQYSVAAFGAGGGNQFPLTYPSAGNGPSNSATLGGVQGQLRINNIRDANRPKSATFQSNYLITGGAQTYHLQGGAWRNLQMALTGLRLLWGTGNFAAGGAVTLWGSP